MRIYTLSLHDEYGAEYLKATTDKAAVPAMLESYAGGDGVLGYGVIEVTDDERRRLAELLAADEPGKESLASGWGGFQLHIVDAFFS